MPAHRGRHSNRLGEARGEKYLSERGGEGMREKEGKPAPFI